MGVKKADAKRAPPSLYHRNPNTVRGTARKPFTRLSHGILPRARIDDAGRRWVLHATRGWRIA